MALIKRVFPYESDARAFVDGMVEALRTCEKTTVPHDSPIWGIELHKDVRQESYGIGMVHVKNKEQYIVEWNVEDK